MHNRRKGHTANKVIFWVSLVGALICVAVTVFYYWSRYCSVRDYENLRGAVADTEASAEVDHSTLSDADREALLADPTLEDVENTPFTGLIEGPAPKIPEEVLTDAQESPIDFDKLSAINPDLYAWIRIPDTQIDYPVAQRMGEDNQEYYLHHDLYGTPQFAGCIFSQEPNRKDFTDPVTVLYGHNMKNGSMFQNLYKFTEEDFFYRDHNYVYVYTPEGTLIYEVYAAYYADDRNILEELDFSKKEDLEKDPEKDLEEDQEKDQGKDPEEDLEKDPEKDLKEDLEKFVESTRQPRSMGALNKEDISVTTDDKILTLSTCVYGQTSARLLVQAVLLYKESE